VWKHVAQSLQGPSHAATGAPCQDSHHLRVLGEVPAQTLIACVADGAGSMKHSEIGSALACEAIADNAARYQRAHGNFDGLQFQDVLSWCENVRELLLSAAGEHGCLMRELATTLCAAIVAPEGSFFFQIGDGAITVGNHGIYGVVFWPQSGEYANVTNFLTSDTFQDHLEFQATTSQISELALFTDGIERLALNFENQTPHLPFFQPFFLAVRDAKKQQQLAGDLSQFLQSDSVNHRSDDDRTLVLATQLPPTVKGAASEEATNATG